MKLMPYDREKGGYIIQCPGCDTYHLMDTRWTFNGNQDFPTFTPSAKVSIEEMVAEGKIAKNSVCHFFITDGKIKFLSDCTHKLKNQIVDLPDIE